MPSAQDLELNASTVFSISLGALPGQQMITTQLTVGSTSFRVLTGLIFCCLQYVLDLMDGDVTDQIRLQLPMYIGMRYGTIPSSMADASTAPPHRISISADVRMQGAVKKITSPTHPTVTIDGGGSTTSYPLNAHYGSQDFLKQDFVLSITAEGLDAPRCFAQRAANGATAIQLSIVPKFHLPSISRQEYIFSGGPERKHGREPNRDGKADAGHAAARASKPGNAV
jgi:hypothetical protein